MKNISSCAVFVLGLVSIAISVAVGFLSMMHGSVVERTDIIVESYISSVRMQWLLDWMWVVTSIGDFDILALIILVTALMFALHRQWKPLTCLLTSAVLVNILTIMTKNYFERARPMLDGVSVGGYSFPSGHTTGAFVVFGIVAWVFLNEVENKKVKYLGVTLAVVIGSLVGISRVYLGAHWASDVYGGVLVAAGIMLVITSLINYVADHMAS